jgi:transcriptional regulator GlxA family with amidase domain
MAHVTDSLQTARAVSVDLHGVVTGPCASPPREVLFVLVREVVLMDLAGPVDAFRGANVAAPSSYRLRFVAPHGRVAVAGGLILDGCEPFPAALAPGTILVVLGSGYEGRRVDPGDPAMRHAIEWLRGIAGASQLLCVADGSVLAAYAGLLAGRECTTHPAHLDELRRADPRARVLGNRVFVEDGPVFTSAGVSAGLDLALHVIGQQLGARVAASVAQHLVVYLRRAGTEPAVSPWVMHRDHLHPAVHRVQDAVTREPAARWDARELSAVACTSVRNLSRLFREHVGCSPLHYVQLIRMALARQLLVQSRLDLESVAARAGFRSARHLRRVWSRWEPRPPSALRGNGAAAIN